MQRLGRALRALDPDQRLAGLAALALLATMLLPWYEKNVFVGGAFVSDSVSAFGTFSFVEAAVLLVAAGVLALLFARGERRGFHLPGGDGAVVVAAGAWAALLLLWRVFDRPEAVGAGATVGIQWGFLAAFAAAAALIASGARIRAARRPEPPLARAQTEDDAGWTVVTAEPRARPRRPRPAGAVRFGPPPTLEDPPEPPPAPRQRRRRSS